MQTIPSQIIKLASTLFAKQTGFSGPEITNFFGKYDDNVVDYWHKEKDEMESRWKMFEKCLSLLPYPKQIDVLLDLCDLPESEFTKYPKPSVTQIEILKLKLLGLKGVYVEVPKVKAINFEYINEQIKKSEEKMLSKDYDGAITNSRSLLESVLLFIITKKGLPTDNLKGDLPRMFNSVMNILQLDPKQTKDKDFLQMISGCYSIVNGLASYRNRESDAHGKIIEGYGKPNMLHVRFCINAVRTLSDFLMDYFTTQ